MIARPHIGGEDKRAWPGEDIGCFLHFFSTDSTGASGALECARPREEMDVGGVFVSLGNTSDSVDSNRSRGVIGHWLLGHGDERLGQRKRQKKTQGL